MTFLYNLFCYRCYRSLGFAQLVKSRVKTGTGKCGNTGNTVTKDSKKTW
jgi:hypothetical protein